MPTATVQAPSIPRTLADAGLVFVFSPWSLHPSPGRLRAADDMLTTTARYPFHWVQGGIVVSARVADRARQDLSYAIAYATELEG